MPNFSFEFIIIKPEEDDYTKTFLKCITLKLLKDVYTLDTLRMVQDGHVYPLLWLNSLLQVMTIQ